MLWARPDNLHSRLVLWLKILLPLSALVVLSTLFMVSHTVRPEDAIPYSDIDVTQLANEPRLTAPDFNGMTSDGAALSLTADMARIGDTGKADAGLITGLAGLLETPDGGNTVLSAVQARLDASGKSMVLDGGVRISNSAGYNIETQQLLVALDKTSIDSTGAITATGPVGNIRAGSMHIGLSGVSADDYVLVFKNGVQMIYLPAKQGTGN